MPAAVLLTAFFAAIRRTLTFPEGNRVSAGAGRAAALGVLLAVILGSGGFAGAFGGETADTAAAAADTVSADFCPLPAPKTPPAEEMPADGGTAVRTWAFALSTSAGQQLRSGGSASGRKYCKFLFADFSASGGLPAVAYSSPRRNPRQIFAFQFQQPRSFPIRGGPRSVCR